MALSNKKNSKMAATRIYFAAVKGKLGFGKVATKNVLSKLIFPAAAGHRTTRLYSSDKPISRFPVPEVSHLPEDIQETMKEVEEKVGWAGSCLSLSVATGSLDPFGT